MAPTLQCLGYAFEIGLKAMLIVGDGDLDQVGKTYGHRLNDLWEADGLKQVRQLTKEAAARWYYPDHWPQDGSSYDCFLKQFRWLGNIHAGRSVDGEYTGDFSLRYPTDEKTSVYPPDYLLEAADSILGFVEGELQRTAGKT